MGKKREPSQKQIEYGRRRRANTEARRCLDGLWLCTKCKQHKPLSDYLPWKEENRSPPSHCYACCKISTKAGAEKRRQKNIDKIEATKAANAKERKMHLMSQMLTCGRCGSTKPRSEWPIERGTAKGNFLGKTRKYCCSPSKRTDAEVEADIAAQSKVCPSCGIRKSFNDFSPNKLAKDGRQTTCKPCRSAKVHSGEWNGNVRRKDTIHERSDGTITTEFIKKIFSVKICPCCDGYMERDDKVLDHIIPLKLGGMHSANNVTVMCWSCNAGKAARHPSRWLQLLNDEASARMRDHYNKMGLNFDE